MQLLLCRSLIFRGSRSRNLFMYAKVLSNSFRSCTTTSKEKELSPLTSSSTVELKDFLDMDETMTLNVYQPHSEEEAKLQEATREYLRILIMTPDEQEWKDMLSAAIRLNKWREHHLRAVLRSIYQSQYDGNIITSERKSSRGIGSTPATRLSRAIDVVKTGMDEGYRAKPESIHTLLVILLRAASPNLINNNDEIIGENCQSVTPLISRATLWQFLAWMERHDYHVMSPAVLQSLERVVEDEVHDDVSQTRSCSVRQNRLEYLQNEHNRLCNNNSTDLQQKYTGKVIPPMTALDDS